MAHRDLEERVSILEIVLGGNMATKEKGLVNVVQDIAKDVYDPDNGVSNRLRKLEAFRTQTEERAYGAAWVIKIAWVTVGSLMTIFAFMLAHWAGLVKLVK